MLNYYRNSLIEKTEKMDVKYVSIISYRDLGGLGNAWSTPCFDW